MKTPKMIMAAIALCMSMAAFSQTDSTKTRKDTTTQKTDTTTRKKDTATQAPDQVSPAASQGISGAQSQSSSAVSGTQTQVAGAETNVTGSHTATTQESAPKPNFGRYYIPVLGSYQSSQSTASTNSTSADHKSVTVTGDESNPGKIWVEGLTDTRFYAILKAVPGTYKVPVQTQENSSIQEGTVTYDENSKQITICLGCGYSNTTSSEIVTTSTDNNTATASNGKELSKKTVKKSALKEKAKTVINFTGTKSGEATASLNQ